MAATHPRHFLLLPTEIHIKIFLKLDGQSLMRCSSVCRDLATLISSELALQYNVQLAKAGMIEDPVGSAGIPLSERVEKVKAYRTAWQTPTVVFDTRFPQRPAQLKLLPMTGGALPFVTGPHSLNIWRPGSSLRGVPEVRISCSGALLNLRYSSISVDLEQDLVVLTTETWHQGMFGVAEYRVHFLTTAGIPHPLAAQPELRGPGEFLPPPNIPRVVSSTEIFGDLIAWSASTNPGQILVWNWKTGEVLLRLTPYVPDSCFKFLDESHLLVLFDQDVRIYDFSPTSPLGGIPDPLPTAPLTQDDCPCALRLPPFAHEAVHALDPYLHMPSAPSTSSSTPPLFRHDRARTVVCVAFSLLSIARSDPLDRPFEHYVFLFTASALLAQFQRVRDRGAAPSGDVPWEGWGPASCRVCRVPSVHPSSTGVSGTKVVLSRPLRVEADADAGGRCVRTQLQVVDINPCAAPGGVNDPPTPPSLAASPMAAPPLADPGEHGGVVESRFFRGGSVRSEIPYTLATHEVCLGLEDGAADVQRNESGRHELFVFEDQWMFLYVEPERDGVPNPFVATGVDAMQV